ncbi:B-4DMT family transporter [[Mycobacterium] nativiensis]|uniref:B-4DMT family transporter n=1 Tax=[Mycobacterium] nativiensis TaxID=2855503 RepID=A0ABU5XST7_9MYCO|nr:B-4DMT family transporter [Mycolicibacter sp. MYC340]MEB3031039.1 B-4DMT family transporter [Mycolicibacter sp. MYC340]
MSKWFLRGLVFAALMVVVRLIQGVLINAFEAQAGLISLALVVLFVVPVLLWGMSDGRADATANPDPDRRDDLAMTWLGAGLIAGLLSGLVCWIIALVDKALYVSTFFNELTSFAAFTALLVFVPAVAAVSLGRRRVDRNRAKMPQHHHGLAAQGEAAPATDVFATVGAAPLASEGVAAQTEAVTTDAGATLADAGAGFTTEEIPADTEATTEIPAVDEGGSETQGN